MGKETPERTSRRQFLKLVSAAALYLVACGENTERNVQLSGRLEEERDFRRAQENLRKSLVWMKNTDNVEVKGAAESLELLSNENGGIDFVNSGISNELVSVTTYSGPDRKPLIVLSLSGFSDREFDVLAAAVSLYEALYVYQEA
ncbi:hypothetical protein HYW39_02915, partial [Candidatus Curtissbacteria bacterium]|nr:hypothetical protein [Candidatus Curtissbacteria bacterium]